MELHRKQCDAVSLPFAHALKSAFDFHEAKIISALSFDVIGVIPHLSESGIMERNLRKLMIERNLVSSAKSCLVLQRIHEMGADGYVSFVMLLQRNRSNIVYQKLAEQLLMAAQEFYESWRNGLYSSCHFHRIESNLSSRCGVMFCSPDQTASVAVNMRLHGDVAAALPSGYNLPNTFEPLYHCTGCTLPPVYPHQQSLHDANEQCTSILDGKLHCDTGTLSVTCFTEESVCVLVKRFYESGGSQVERVGTEKIFRTLMWQAKASKDSWKLVNEVKVYKCCYLKEVLQYYCQHGERTTQPVHVTERLMDLMSSIDTDTLSPVMATSLQTIKDAYQHS